MHFHLQGPAWPSSERLGVPRGTDWWLDSHPHGLHTVPTTHLLILASCPLVSALAHPPPSPGLSVTTDMLDLQQHKVTLSHSEARRLKSDYRAAIRVGQGHTDLRGSALAQILEAPSLPRLRPPDSAHSPSVVIAFFCSVRAPWTALFQGTRAGEGLT